MHIRLSPGDSRHPKRFQTPSAEKQPTYHVCAGIAMGRLVPEILRPSGIYGNIKEFAKAFQGIKMDLIFALVAALDGHRAGFVGQAQRRLAEWLFFQYFGMQHDFGQFSAQGHI